jgi:outer membrane protein
VIGHAPGFLAPPPPLPPLPTSADEAVRIALGNNPDLVAAANGARAAGYDVGSARASRLPQLSAGVSDTYVRSTGGYGPGLSDDGNKVTAGLNARIPLFQGGAPAAKIRQAQALEGQALDQVIATERSVVSVTRSAFASYDAAQKAIVSNGVAVKANELALEGARAEQSVGTRSVLDVLNAEQELLNAQVALVSAKRDAYVAGFQLLNAMGQAEARDLGLDGGPLYDPLGNYRHVSNNISDWSSDPRHLPTATRTVDPAEIPETPVVTPELVPMTVMTEPVVTSGVTPPRQ